MDIARGTWGRRALALVAVLLLSELALRGLVLLRVRWGEPPHCGMQPEIAHRIMLAFGCCGIDGRTMRADPHRGYRHAANVTDQEDSGATFSTNSLGARGRREYPLPRSPATPRAVAIGDSFTFGQGVSDDATWPAQLEQRLPGTEVVNLGERGYGHDQMYYALRDDGLPLRPDVVILGYYDADRVRNELTFYCSEKPRLTPTADGWIEENVPVPTPDETRRRFLLLPLLYTLPRALLEVLRHPGMLMEERRGDPARTATIIDRMRQAAAGAGARLVLVHLPEHPERPPQRDGFFHDYCARSGAECVDPWPDFAAAAGTTDEAALRDRYSLHPGDIHYSPAGYAVVANALGRYLTDHPITPCADCGP